VLIAGGLFLVRTAYDDPALEPATATPVAAPSVPLAVRPSARPAPATEHATGQAAAPARSPGGVPAGGLLPEVVVVPALDVRAPTTPIRTEGGALTPPADPQRVGWWSGGARPGAAEGAAVVTGHTVQSGGGAFDDLETLSSGDRVVVRSGTEEVSYTVDTVEVLSRDELARRSAELFARSGAPRLVLVTCEDWDGSAYRSNVVVTALPRA